jgi:hypothetical protein
MGLRNEGSHCAADFRPIHAQSSRRFPSYDFVAKMRNGRKTNYRVTLTNRLTMPDPALVANHVPHPLVNKAIRCDGMRGCKEMIVH